MDLLLKAFANYILNPFLKFYLRKERGFSYKGFRLIVSPGVFHPGFFFSTKFLTDFVAVLELKNKKFCEPGTGSGLVSLFALKEGAFVTAFDSNSKAVENCKHNFESNKLLFGENATFQVFQSNLFDIIPVQAFDYIVVNPPYFFGKVTNDASMAWYAGKEGEYFEKFFQQIGNYLHTYSRVYMILADNCEIEKIKTIAAKYDYKFQLVKRKKIWWEENSIYEIRNCTWTD